MRAHLERANALLAMNTDGQMPEPLRILSIRGPQLLKLVTTTGTEAKRKRRYFLTPDAATPSGWKIVEVQVQCAVCKGRGLIHGGFECHFCHATGWLQVPSTSSLLHPA